MGAHRAFPVERKKDAPREARPTSACARRPAFPLLRQDGKGGHLASLFRFRDDKDVYKRQLPSKPREHPAEYIGGHERTQGSEPSQYLKEKKETSIPLVVASERGVGQCLISN